MLDVPTVTITLELTPEQEALLNRKATAVALTPSEYLVSLIGDAKPDLDTAPARPRTGAEVMDAIEAMHLSGSYGDPSIDSPELARQIREQSNRSWDDH